jgi:hypothetical protein
MTLTPQQQLDNIARESEAWADSAFGGLDLSAYPNLAPEPQPDRDEGRFAQPWESAPYARSAQALRAFVANPDEEAMAETGNPAFGVDVRDRRAERIIEQFKAARPDYVMTDDNTETMVLTMAENFLPASEREGSTDELIDAMMRHQTWTATNLCVVYDELNSQGYLDVETGKPRNLSDSERLRVSRLAQSGNLEAALGLYLASALPDVEPSIELASDPDYRETCDQAVMDVWISARPDYVYSAERDYFLRRHAGSRPLTIPLLDSGWVALKAHEARRGRQELVNNLRSRAEPVTERGIDELGDSQLDELYHAALRERARTRR